MARVKWHGDDARGKIQAELRRRVRASAIVVSVRAKELLSVPGTASAIRKISYHYGGERRTAGKRGRIYGAAVSRPGEPPRKQFGHLRRSVTWEPTRDGLNARDGTNLKYGRWLELGTAKLRPRPWLRRALAESRTTINAIFRRPMSR